MINAIADYKYIYPGEFKSLDGSSTSITIDGDVYGSRPQKPITRNVDYCYLLELQGFLDNSIEGSIRFDYPIKLGKDFPTPSLTFYADKDKINSLSVGEDELFYMAGGDDPDYEGINRRQEAQRAAFAESKKNAEKTRDDALSAAEDELKKARQTYDEDLAQISNEISAIQAVLTTSLSTIELTRDNALSTIDYEIEKLLSTDLPLSSKTQSLVEFEKQKHDAQFKFWEDNSTAWKKRDDDTAEHFGKVNTIESTFKKAEDDYKTAVDNALSTCNDTIKKAQRTLDEQENQNYLDSNLHLGYPLKDTYNDLYEQLNNLIPYNAHGNVSCEVPWMPGKYNEYYIQRLFADWDKCQWRDVTQNIVCHQHVDGMIGRYSGPIYNYRRYYGGTYLAYREHYNSGDESIEYSVLDSTIDLFVGNRNQMNNIEDVIVVIQIYAAGVNGIGWKYDIVHPSRVGVKNEDYLKRLDDLDIKNVKDNIDIDLLLDKEKREENLRYAKEVDEIDEELRQGLKSLEDELDDNLRSINGAFMQSAEPIMKQSNTDKREGKDIQQYVQQISQLTFDKWNRDSQARITNNNKKYQFQQSIDQKYTNARRNNRENLQHINDVYYTQKNDLNYQYGLDRGNILRQQREDFRKEQEDIYESFENAADQINDEYHRANKELADQEDEVAQRCQEQLEKEFPPDEEGEPTQEDIARIFKPLVDIQKQHEPIYNANYMKRENSMCDAQAEYARNIAESYDLRENARELWQFNAGGYASFIDNFKDHDPTYTGMYSSCRFAGTIKVYAKLKSDKFTGYAYKDYEKIDKGEDEESNGGQNN